MAQEEKNIRILFAEDLSTDVELACRTIKKENIPFTYRVVETEAAFLKELNQFNPDVVVSDYAMPVFDGMSALKITRSKFPYIPFIVLTGTINEETAVKCIKAGANDYVLKENITRLPFAIKEAIEKNNVRREKEQMEKRVLDSLYEYQDLINSMNETVWIISPEGKLLDVNDRAEDLLGYKRKELLEKGLSLVYEKGSQPDIKDLLKTLKNKIHVCQTTHVAKNGNKIPVEISSALIKYKGKQAILNVARNISERIKAEEKMRLLGKAIKQSPVVIEITDAAGKIEYVNPAFTNITGYEPEEVIGKTPGVYHTGFYDAGFYKEMYNDLLSGKDWSGILKNKRKNGEIYREQVILSPIINEQNQVTNFVSVKEDITEKKKMFEDLVKAKERAEESDKLKSAFLANMSHEIRTPMNGILGFTDLLKDEELTGEQVQTYIDIIQRNGQRMLNTVNDIIEISKIETGQVEVRCHEFDVHNEIKGLHDFFLLEAEKKSLQLIFDNEINDKPVMLYTDENKLISICTNLIKNAIKYTEKGHVKFGYDVKEGKFRFYVQDTGIGIPEERQEAIFGWFTQADIPDSKALQGSGLGLSIAKSYVEMLQGAINVESEPGKASTFCFTIPFKTRNNQHGNNTSKITHSNNITLCKQHLKTMIVEDDPTADIFLSAVMRDYSREILHAKSGTEALALSRKHPDIDLVLMDIKIPDIDGYLVTKKIRHDNNDVIIIAQTAYVSPDAKQKALNAGCDDYISKPLRRNKLMEIINKQLAS
ncbi:MAG: PAS domain S-box protein [Candidatus Delongbacteria bacterium]|jgi:PAS domain S-box-containing protein|nr:PAS domain S-box protein [Candidatus Delongbacteria bacterium]